MVQVIQPIKSGNLAFSGQKQVSEKRFSLQAGAIKQPDSNVSFGTGFWQRLIAYMFPQIDQRRQEVTDKTSTEVKQATNFLTELMASHVSPNKSVIVNPMVASTPEQLSEAAKPALNLLA